MQINFLRSLRLSIVFVLLIGFPFRGWSQSYKQTIQQLASPEFNGRGYYKKGDHKAADYIADSFKKSGLLPLSGSYLQPFSFPVNTFPGKVEVRLGKSDLIPGKDFIVSPACPPVKGTYSVYQVPYPIPDFSDGKYAGSFLIIDKSGMDSTAMAQLDSLTRNPPNVKGLIVAEPTKLTWSVSQRVSPIALIRIMKDAIPAGCNSITLNVQSKFIPSYQTSNVIGYVPGTTQPDSFIVFTAHYDHLGRMGKKALFAGANDNASGTAMIMDLATHFAKPGNRMQKSILFMAFAGEEAGLVGSEYYSENPLFPLSQMSFLVNLDLMGNGEEGVMVVNGELHEPYFNLLDSLNKELNLVTTVGKRGTAKNSDHYWFSQKGVPAFFLYTMGGSKAYHDIYDTPDQLPLSEFDDIETLLKKFVSLLDSQ